MHPDVPEFELRWRMAVRFAQALPLLVVLVVVIGAALNAAHVPLLGVALGAALGGLVAALGIVWTATWSPAPGRRRDPVPSAEPLTSA